MALRGVVNASKKEKKHIITTKIEHHAILHTAEFLETKGVDVTYLNVDEFGKISLEELENAIRPETVLISVMFANNEIGTIQPIAEIGEIAKKHGVLFHTDAVQAVGHVPIDVEKLHVDLLSMSGHKLGAPKGIGAIYIRKGTRISPLIFGGAQEKKLRAGHIDRLSNAECSVNAGIHFIDLLGNLERVSDHAMNIAQVVLNEHRAEKNFHEEKNVE